MEYGNILNKERLEHVEIYNTLRIASDLFLALLQAYLISADLTVQYRDRQVRGGGALQLHLYGGVWPQDWIIDPSAD